jgi:hypothetical protein
LAKTKLDRFLFEACVKTGAPYELLKDQLELMNDEADATARIQKVSEYLKLKNTSEPEQLIVENSHRPGSGCREVSRTAKLSYLSEAQARFLEEAGLLDGMIREQGR